MAGIRFLEGVFAAFIAIMIAAFGYLFTEAHVPLSKVAMGFLVPQLDRAALPTVRGSLRVCECACVCARSQHLKLPFLLSYSCVRMCVRVCMCVSLQAVALFGSLIMPHNIYLHSALVRDPLEGHSRLQQGHLGHPLPLHVSFSVPASFYDWLKSSRDYKNG